MTIASCIKVDMKTLKKLICTFEPSISICIRGRHAVGKSEGTYQAAKLLRDDFYKIPENAAKYNWKYEYGLPVIERRLSQLTEGDLTGMPDLSSDRLSTSFKPCDWLIDACNRPVVLFLDERNRALEGVKQAVFQLMDSHAFYGYKLHPGTRVIVAENVGDIYNVQQCDPAETSRPATVELNPTVEEWIDYAADFCDPLTINFILANKDCLEVTNAAIEPNKKYPDRRSWFKLDQQLQKSGMINKPNDPLFYAMAGSMVGIETALRFVEFAKTNDFQVTAEEIVTDWAQAKKKIGKTASPSKYIELSKKLELFLKDKSLTKNQGREIGEFMKDCPAEIRMLVWGFLSTNSNLYVVHPYVDKLLAETATNSYSNE